LEDNNLGIVITVKIRCPCNYNCIYCVAKNTIEDTNVFNLNEIERLYKSLESFIVTELECGGSEPTIHPQIRGLLEVCLKYGIVSIPTNNSIPPERWLPSENVNKLLVRAAFHQQAEKDIYGFIDRLTKIIKIGGNVHVVFVAHPDRMEKIDSYSRIFQQNNITMVITPFNGIYNDREYPESYTNKELEIINQGNVKTQSWQALLSIEARIRNFSGIPCLAGYKKFYLDEKGKIFRCLYDTKVIDQPFNSAKPCEVEYCGCGLLLSELNELDENFWNYCRGIANLPYTQKLKNLGTKETFKEKRKIYWNLMKRYKKETMMQRMKRIIHDFLHKSNIE
jgi:organic radical activating enzyme